MFNEVFAALKLIRENDLHHMERSMVNVEALMNRFDGKLDAFNEKIDRNIKETIRNKTDITWVRWIVMAFGGAVVVQVVAMIFK